MKGKKGIFFILIFIFSSIICNAEESEDQFPSIDTDITISADSLYKLARSRFQKSDYEQCLVFSEKGILQAKEEKNYKRLGDLYLMEAYVYLGWGLPKKAIVRFSQAGEMGEQEQDKDLIIGGHHGKGRAYIDLKMYKKAIVELKMGLKVNRDPINLNQQSIINNAMGMAYQELENYDKALESFRKFYSISRARNDSVNFLYGLANIGEVFNLMGQHDSALFYFNAAKKVNATIQNRQAQAAILGNLAEVYHSNGDYLQSNLLLHQSVYWCRIAKLNKFRMANYELFISNFDSLGQTDSSIYYYKKLLHFKDSINLLDRSSTINYLDAQNKANSRMRDAQILAQKLKNRNSFLILSTAITALIILLLILLYNRYKLGQKIYKKETAELSKTIDEKNRELVGKILSEHEKEMDKAIGVEIIKKVIASEKDAHTVEVLNKLMKDINKGRTVSFNWDNFKLHFEQVHPDFFNILKSNCPSLTTNELRQCAYMKMNLSTKEIAGLTNISDRAVQTARYRIKKKLQLPPETDLISYIQAF